MSAKRLLIIADDWEALERYEDRLSPSFEVTGSPFGSDGIRIAGEQNFDRILLDLTSEDMSPEEACLALRGDPKTATIPLTVVLNADAPELTIGSLFPRAGDQWVRRPYDFEGLKDGLF